MKQTLEVTYYHHSGFSCAMGSVLLVFDYWLGEHAWLPEEKRITTDMLEQFDEVYVFISHEHPDHLDRAVLGWANLHNVCYITSYDMPDEVELEGVKELIPGTRMYPGDEIRFGAHLTVRAFESTDLGVAFLAVLDGMNIFHAGDLNFWHWREESTVAEIEQAESDFHHACLPIKGLPIDLAFFPLDPRQGRLYDAGANYFMMTIKPRLMLPMHFWNRGEIATEYARRADNSDTEVIALTRIGEKMRIDIEEDGFMTVNLLSAPEPAQKMGHAVNLDVYETADPFRTSEDPVDELKLDDDDAADEDAE